LWTRRDILEQQQAGGWGDGIVGRIAEDLRATTGQPGGFSRSNVFSMRKFAASWPDLEKVNVTTAACNLGPNADAAISSGNSSLPSRSPTTSRRTSVSPRSSTRSGLA
jgi:hypothetical protein